MNKWDVLSFSCFLLALGISFNVFDWLLIEKGWMILFKFTLLGVGAYFLWYKGSLFKGQFTK